MNKLKCYIYGAGNEYSRFCSYLPLYENQIEILGIVTTKRQSFSRMDGIPCIVPEEIEQDKMDYVIIAVCKWKEIADILELYNIPKQKIIRSSSFYYPFFSLHEFLKLKRNPISILSNFCWGGMIYQKLGMEVLSPTIDMFCLGMTYIDFLNDYRKYLKLDMVPYDMQISAYIKGTLGDEMFIPKGIIQDTEILWYFNHSSNAESAIAKWNERRGRVDFENIAALMIINTDEEAYAFEHIPIKKKIGLYYKDLSLPNIIYCPDWLNNENLRQQYGYRWGWFADVYGLNKVNWLKFLTDQEKYVRY